MKEGKVGEAIEALHHVAVSLVELEEDSYLFVAVFARI